MTAILIFWVCLGTLGRLVLQIEERTQVKHASQWCIRAERLQDRLRVRWSAEDCDGDGFTSQGKWGLSKIKGTILGVLIVSNIAFQGLFGGPLILGNYQVSRDWFVLEMLDECGHVCGTTGQLGEV